MEVLLKTPIFLQTLTNFCLHMMKKNNLRVTPMLFDMCLSLTETLGYSKGQPTPSQIGPNMSLLQNYMIKIQPFTTSLTLFYHKTSYPILKRYFRTVQIRPFCNLDL